MIPILISFCLLFHDQNTFCPTLSLKFGASLPSSWPPPEMDGHWSAQLRIFFKKKYRNVEIIKNSLLSGDRSSVLSLADGGL